MEDDLPAPPVNGCFVVELAEQPAVGDAGGAAVLLVAQVVHVGGGGRPVAAARPGAVLVAQDDGAADVRRDRVGVADVQRQAGVLKGGSRSPVRSAEARPDGLETKSMASRAIAYRCACRTAGVICSTGAAWARVMILSMTVMSACPTTTGTVIESQAATSASLPAR